MGVSILTASSLALANSSSPSSVVSAFTCGLVAEVSTAAMREAAVVPETALAAAGRLRVTRGGILMVDLGVTMDDLDATLLRGENSDRDDAVAEDRLEGRISSFPEDEERGFDGCSSLLALFLSGDMLMAIRASDAVKSSSAKAERVVLLIVDPYLFCVLDLSLLFL